MIYNLVILKTIAEKDFMFFIILPNFQKLKGFFSTTDDPSAE